MGRPHWMAGNRTKQQNEYGRSAGFDQIESISQIGRDEACVPSPLAPSFRGAPLGASPESIKPQSPWSDGFGPRPSASPRKDDSGRPLSRTVSAARAPPAPGPRPRRL